MAPGYGLPPEATEQTETMLRDHFHVRDRTDVEASTRRCRAIDARWYGTVHQRGVIEGAT
ncbi:hypothetical protein [Streptomyces sp. NPDC050848]|uniref:hypothetical protein n=1 Tax=Streptomyces sp. NPDC050848 TaxID=3155791 RepID=UPI0033F18168